ncbi:MAG TPA: efflux RND transporter permease subunit, partial [Candidatus Xenobia bacterium]|jgi:hydrophobe/amphiphile efflux-1 (HAE1) family protein
MILLAAGVYCFRSLGIDDEPNIDLPYVYVDVSMPGAAPAELESQVTRKIEDAVVSVGNIKHVNSTVSVGDSNTFIEFEFGTNIDRATNDVRDAVARVRSTLPASIPDPYIRHVDNSDNPFASYTVSSPRLDVGQLSWLVDNDITRAVLAVSGVGALERHGGVDREVRVELDPVALDSMGLTADVVSGQIRALNVNMPGGRGDIGASEQAVRTLGSAETLDELKAARIPLPSGGWARLDTLGSVSDTSAEQRHRALLDGKLVVAFGVTRSLGANVVAVGDAVDRALANVQKSLPKGVTINKVSTDATYVMDSYRDSLDTLIVGAALAVLVIWLFLRDGRAAIISALAMPISIIPTFAAMKACNFTLNNMSLLGLSLVIGILVDDAIVEIENIVRHIHMGRKPFDAAIEAADEIGLAVVATTMSIMVVFLPVGFMGGIPGQYFKPFGITVAVAVFFSLVVARLLTPVMAAYWMKAPPHDDRPGRLQQAYQAMLAWALRWRVATVLLAIAFFGVGLWLFSTIPTSLMTAVDQGYTWIRVTLPPGSTLDETTAVCVDMNHILHQHAEVQTVYTSVGVDTASLRVQLVPKNERKLSQMQFEDLVRPELRDIPGVRVSCGGGGMSNSMTVVLAGNNGAELRQASDALMAQMRGVPDIAEVTSDAALQRPEIEVVPDLSLAAEQGVSVESIANTAQIALLGDADMNLPKFNLPDRQINIRVELAPRYRQDLNTIRNLKLLTSTNHLVPLESVARVELSIGDNQVKRIDRVRQVSISGTLKHGAALGTVMAEVYALPAYRNLPASVTDKPNGNVEIQKDVFSGFAAAMGAGILLIYAVLILLFSDFVQPLTIMVSLPLSVTGALVALVMTGQPLGLYGLIGLLMLMGLCTKNAILLVEYCIMAQRGGMDRTEAIMKSGEARMRPIVMTTVAMIAGMLPITAGLGAGAEARAPMAMTVIGGLITSTFLTLLVVPVVYTLLDDLKLASLRFIRRLTAEPAPVPEPARPG